MKKRSKILKLLLVAAILITNVNSSGGNLVQATANRETKAAKEPPRERVCRTSQDASKNQESPYQDPTPAEEGLIKKVWGNKSAAVVKALKPAVISPEMNCRYANSVNGYGWDVSFKDVYAKMDLKWEKELQGNIRYTPYERGNYRFYVKDMWGKPKGTYDIIIVDRGTATYAGEEQYYINNRKMPKIASTTNDTNPAKIQYEFDGRYLGGSISYSNQFPWTPGIYDVTAKLPENVENHYLGPTVTKKAVKIFPKGEVLKYKRGTGNGDMTDMTDGDWKGVQKPVGEYTKFFGVDIFEEKKTVVLPTLQNTEDQIFEGWYEDEKFTKPLQKNDKGQSYYTVATLGNTTPEYVQEKTLYAKFRNRKTQEVSISKKVENGFKDNQNGYAVSGEGFSNNKKTVKETDQGTGTVGKVTATTQSTYGYEFDGWYKDNQKVESQPTYTIPEIDFSKLGQTSTSEYQARFKGKEYKITFHAGYTENGNKEETSEQTVRYYDESAKLTKNSFDREGYTFKGWSTTKGGGVQYSDQGQAYNVPINGLESVSNGSVPTTVDLYAVWEKGAPVVEFEQPKDSVLLQGNESELGKSYMGGLYITGNSTEFGGAELARVYFNVKDVENQKSLNPQKFKVIWQQKKTGQAEWTKLNPVYTNDNPYLLDLAATPSAKVGTRVFWDEEKQQWFASLIVRRNKGIDKTRDEAEYKVSVAYDDGTSTQKIASQEEFLKGDESGWYTSNLSEVRIIDNLNTMVSIPAEIHLKEQEEKKADGTVNEVIQSDDVTVTVNKLAHKLGATTEEDKTTGDYNWLSPQTARTGNENNYTGGDHSAFKKNQPFTLQAEWNNTMTSSAGSITDVYMYNTKDHQRTDNMTGTFKYDGDANATDPAVKQVFSFYLKGSKPKGVPNGTLYKGTIHFKLTNLK